MISIDWTIAVDMVICKKISKSGYLSVTAEEINRWMKQHNGEFVVGQGSAALIFDEEQDTLAFKLKYGI